MAAVDRLRLLTIVRRQANKCRMLNDVKISLTLNVNINLVVRTSYSAVGVLYLTLMIHFNIFPATLGSYPRTPNKSMREATTFK